MKNDCFYFDEETDDCIIECEISQGVAHFTKCNGRCEDYFKSSDTGILADRRTPISCSSENEMERAEMTEKQQIDQLAKDLDERLSWQNYWMVDCHKSAEQLYNAGWRKQSDDEGRIVI